jgi:hypothetical protein
MYVYMCVCVYMCVLCWNYYNPYHGNSVRLCLTKVDRWRHSVSDVVEYVMTEKVARIYFQHTSCIRTPVG